MKILKKILVFLLACTIIAAILPIGYFLWGVLFQGNSVEDAFKDSLLTFVIMFVIAFAGLLINKD